MAKKEKSNYIQPRGDYFYYIEVWDKAAFRDSKIASVLGENVVRPSYLSGSQKQLVKQESRQCALYWKNRETAEFRIELMNRHKGYADNMYIIKELNREEFISLIRDDFKSNNQYSLAIYHRNKEMKQKEITYKRKIENPWRNYNKNLEDVLL